MRIQNFNYFNSQEASRSGSSQSANVVSQDAFDHDLKTMYGSPEDDFQAKGASGWICHITEGCATASCVCTK